MTTKKKKIIVTNFATLSACNMFGDHRVDGEPISADENAGIYETYAMIARMLQELATQGVTAGSKLLVSIEVIKAAAPKPKAKTKEKRPSKAGSMKSHSTGETK